MSELAIQMEGVEKAYRFFSLRDLRLELEPGQILGFVGPNGAGKSTTIRILMALVHQDDGDVRVLGRSMPREQAIAKRDIGYMSEDMRLYGGATIAWHEVNQVAFVPLPTLSGRTLEIAPDQPADEIWLQVQDGEQTSDVAARARAPPAAAAARRADHRPRPGRALRDPARAHRRDERRAPLDPVLVAEHAGRRQISDQITFLDAQPFEVEHEDFAIDGLESLHKLMALPEVTEISASGRIATATVKAYTHEIAAAFTSAGATVRDVQRMSLEEIFVANVMLSRKETST
jgi:ABC-2 type transport system ATP-binding protein